jgi:hypothetical protein
MLVDAQNGSVGIISTAVDHVQLALVSHASLLDTDMQVSKVALMLEPIDGWQKFLVNNLPLLSV